MEYWWALQSRALGVAIQPCPVHLGQGEGRGMMGDISLSHAPASRGQKRWLQNPRCFAPTVPSFCCAQCGTISVTGELLTYLSLSDPFYQRFSVPSSPGAINISEFSDPRETMPMENANPLALPHNVVPSSVDCLYHSQADQSQY